MFPCSLHLPVFWLSDTLERLGIDMSMVAALPDKSSKGKNALRERCLGTNAR